MFGRAFEKATAEQKGIGGGCLESSVAERPASFEGIGVRIVCS